MEIINESFEDINFNSVDLSIIIPVFNNANFTKSCLDDLMKLRGNYEIIIVDNGSTDNTADVVLQAMINQPKDAPILRYLTSPRNLQFGRGNNKGYKHANGKNILFLNNDIRVKERFEDWPSLLLSECKENTMVAANGGLLDSQFNFITETDREMDSEYFYLSGWCLAGSRETFEKLILNHYRHDQTDEMMEGGAWGPWNEKFLCYFEDDDISWRAKEMGMKLKVVPVPVKHFGRMTSKKANLKSLYLESQKTFKEIWKSKMK